jgi:hypothetical protein
MFNSDTEVLFPLRVVPTLRSLHGEEWRRLVDRFQAKEEDAVERFAFVLMMVRMCGCVGCSADSFRAMRGCTLCARQTVKRFRGTDHEIVDQFRQVQKEVEAYLRKMQDDVGSTAALGCNSKK